MTPEELEAALADTTSPNVPKAFPMQGTGGPKPPPPTDATLRRNRAAMSAAMQVSASRDAIFATFTAPPYNLSEDQILRLRHDVERMWADEDADHKRLATGAQRRRLMRQIAEATKDRKWSAVAQLEKVAAEVDGTIAEDPAPNSDADTRLTDAVLAALSAQNPQQLRLLVERQRIYLDTGVDEPLVVRTHKPKSTLLSSGGSSE